MFYLFKKKVSQLNRTDVVAVKQTVQFPRKLSHDHRVGGMLTEQTATVSACCFFSKRGSMRRETNPTLHTTGAFLEI